jgi:deoxycytidine triphosphate deaminase
MVQPSSVDVRLDRYFRLFDNHKYPFIDPAEDQPDLTHLIEVAPTSRSSCTRASSCSVRPSSR